MSASIYIVIEGIDGSGKTVQSKAIAQKIREATRELVYEITEPQKLKGTIGDEIRHRLANGPLLEPWEAVGLFVADRLQLLRTDVEPALKDGRIVIQDRNWLSTCVYNGEWGEIRDFPTQPSAPGAVWLAKHHMKIMPRPDLLVLIDVDKTFAENRLLLRAKETGRKLDQFDKDDKHDERRSRYKQLVALDGIASKKVTVDGSKSVDEVTTTIWRYVSPLLKEKGRL